MLLAAKSTFKCVLEWSLIILTPHQIWCDFNMEFKNLYFSCHYVVNSGNYLFYLVPNWLLLVKRSWLTPRLAPEVMLSVMALSHMTDQNDFHPPTIYNPESCLQWFTIVLDQNNRIFRTIWINTLFAALCLLDGAVYRGPYLLTL